MRVKAGTDPQALASAISHALYEHRVVLLRVIGDRAVYQTMKALVVARKFTVPRGINLVVVPGWTDGVRERGDERTEMTFRVFHLPTPGA